jgi:methylated-DNA-protein-cysteine methyltransferase-like protein
VRLIPPGKVTTYGDIAKSLGTKDARKVGWALHANPYPDVPCHRVVSKDGKLAANFAFDGWREQKKRLTEEGIVFKEEQTLDLKKYSLKLTNFIE